MLTSCWWCQGEETLRRTRAFDPRATDGIACESIGRAIPRDMCTRHQQNKSGGSLRRCDGTGRLENLPHRSVARELPNRYHDLRLGKAIADSFPRSSRFSRFTTGPATPSGDLVMSVDAK